MTKQRRKYDEEFKKRAVEVTYQEGRTIQSTAAGLGIHPSVRVFVQEGNCSCPNRPLSCLRY